MKPALTLCSAVLLLLSSCGGGTTLPSPAEPSPFSIPLTSRITEPIPCEETLSGLPSQLTTSSAELWGDQPIFLLAQLPEKDIFLYGLTVEDNSSQLLLRTGDCLTLYDLPWLTPRSVFPSSVTVTTMVTGIPSCFSSPIQAPVPGSAPGP